MKPNHSPGKLLIVTQPGILLLEEPHHSPSQLLIDTQASILLLGVTSSFTR